MIDPLY